MIAYESALKGDLRLRVEAVSRRTFRVRIADVEASEPGMNRYGFILPQPEPDANVLDADAFLTVETEAASLRVSKEDLRRALRWRRVPASTAWATSPGSGWKKRALPWKCGRRT